MITKQGKNSWRIRIYLGRDPKTGKEKYYIEIFHAPLKTMAQAREQELKKQFQKLGPRREIMTLGEWLDEWLEDIKSTVTEVNYRGYFSHAKMLQPLVGRLNLFDLDAEKLRKALRGRFDHLSPRTQKNILATLKTAVKAAIDARLAPIDALVGFKNVKVPRKPRPVLDREGLARLVEVAGQFKHGLVIRLLAVTGARLGEILGLTWDMVDFKRSAITIDQAVDLHKRELKGDPKTFNSRRTVFLDEETMRLLAEHRQKQMKETVRPLKREKSLVFQAADGRPVSYSVIYETFHHVRQIAGLPDMRIHDIRHSVVSLLLTEGVPVITVAALVGHNVNTTTSKYAQKTKHGKGLEL